MKMIEMDHFFSMFSRIGLRVSLEDFCFKPMGLLDFVV
jgi:hypothetical protein